MNVKHALIGSLLLLFVALLPVSSQAQHLQQFEFNGTDGMAPLGGVIVDAAGNFYGATSLGGAANVGVVYEISPASGSGVTQTVLYSFTGNGSNGDGANPIGDLVLDPAGNLYGVTQFGGNSGGQCFAAGCGTVFELSPPLLPGGAWTESIIYAFPQDLSGGARPAAGLILDFERNLYGTTQFGGTATACGGCGVVFELSPPVLQGRAWTETILYTFQGGFDGSEPLGALVFDQAGKLYGTTSLGGQPGDGTVFELTPPALQGDPWSETILQNFRPEFGSDPQAGLTIAPDGTLYGTTRNGGLKGEGVVFVLKPPSGSAGWQYAFYSFINDTGGPLAGVTLVGNPNILYGATQVNAFQLSLSNNKVTFTALYVFSNSAPAARLTLYKGALYGTTAGDGRKRLPGTVFRLSR